MEDGLQVLTSSVKLLRFRVPHTAFPRLSHAILTFTTQLCTNQAALSLNELVFLTKIMDLQEVGCGYVDSIGLAQDRDGWRTLASAVMNLRVP